MPVGFSPRDVVIGVTGGININDRARVTVGTVSEQVLSTWGNIAAFGSSPSTRTNLGVQSSVGVVWSRPFLEMRGGALEFYKAQTSATAQAGTTFRQPQENRFPVNIRQEPIWTVTMTAPDSGSDVIVGSHQSATLSEGNYGRVIVNGFATLTLTGSNYGFVEFILNERGTVTFTASTPPRIFVRNELTIRSPLARAGMILGYLGTSTAHLDGAITNQSSFVGDLLLAPNAAVEIKRDVVGRIFAKDVTVFEGQTVRGVPLSSTTLDWLRPTESVVATPKGLISTTGAVEIGSALLTPQLNSACAEPRAFVSYHGASMMHKAVSEIGTTAAASFASFVAPTPPPATCLSTWLPVFTPAWTIVPGGMPRYSDAGVFTDNLMTRMSGGRVLHAGFSTRRCIDPAPTTPNPSACPATQPAQDGTCSPTGLSNRACIYGATQCQCLPTTECGNSARAYGAGGLGGTFCLNEAGCCSGICDQTTQPGTCTEPSPLPPTTWACGALDRIDAGTLGIRMSTDCGATFTAGPFDPSAIPVILLDGARARAFDRPEIFWDNFDERLYVNGLANPGPGGAGGSSVSNVVYSASTAGVTSASNLAWQPVQPQIVPGDDDAWIRVMSTVLDERARLNTSPPSVGRYVHLVAARCFGNRPQVQIWTPFGRKTWDLAEGSTDPTTVCRQVGVGENGQPFTQLQFGPSIAGISSVPPRLRVAYTGLAGTGAAEHTIINVYTVTIRSADNYQARPDIVREPTTDVAGRHSVWPQLVAVDGLAASDRQSDSPMVLRWSELGGDLVREKAQVIYSSTVRGPILTLTEWSVAATFPGVDCIAAKTCFNGDYKYGAFFQKTGSSGALRFFTPWTGGGMDPATGNAVANPTANGAFIDVAP